MFNMRFQGSSWSVCLAALFSHTASTLTISQINGDAFLSPYDGETVTDVSGIVTAIGDSGIWIRAPETNTSAIGSNSIYVYSSSIGDEVSVGDEITLDATVSEYRSSDEYLYLTELKSPSNVEVVSSDNTVDPVVLGSSNDTSPPTEQFSSLDNGDVFGVPNNVSQISTTNPTLQPSLYGMDFWESLSGELVQITNVTVLDKSNSYAETWVRGDWAVTGLNSRGGLTSTDKDGNPEAIIVGDPLDGSSNPDTTKLGDTLEDITGVIYYEYGFYYILPQTAISIVASAEPTLPNATDIVSDGTCSSLTFGSYNVENLAPDSDHLTAIAEHIATYLQTPDIVFLQEIQDDDGSTDDGVVSANLTLSTLVEAIANISDITYSFTDIDPVNDESGGETGGNIRNAYLYNSARLHLYNANPGNATEATEVLSGGNISFNPGLIDPTNEAFADSRKPLVAHWETADGEGRFFTINVHFTSKGGSTELEGDQRPPVNGGVEDREAQANVTATWVASLLAEDSDTFVVTAGDFNEYAYVEPLVLFANVSGLQDLDVVVDNPEVERYTYVYDMNSEQLDHVYVSEALAAKDGLSYEHIHVNTWVDQDTEVSDHDPSVGLLNVCLS